MTEAYDTIAFTLMLVFLVVQVLYTATMLIDVYLFSLPVDWVKTEDAKRLAPHELPYIVLFYPVLNELKATMRTTFTAVAKIDYPADRYRVVAIPNTSDAQTVASLRELQAEFPFLQVLEVPPTADPTWNRVWSAWDRNPNAYWWHEGRRRQDRNLPPKKTRQLIYAFYAIAEELRPMGDFVVDYIDADSAPPPDHFMAAAAGLQTYDVLQSTNIAGNLNTTLAASWHAFDHMAWDGLKYPHLSAHGRHPYWMLGKGLFFRASDLESLGSFHPWITIEDPEVGMRFWAHGLKLGIIENPLIEEVPATFGRGVTQRKRWVCGFFQSLGEPTQRLGFSPLDKAAAWLNFLPCMSLWLNAIGFPIGAWALWGFFHGADILPDWAVALAAFNTLAFAVSLTAIYLATWRRTALVLKTRRERLYYLLRVNPLFVMVWWVMWLVPLFIGLRMYLQDQGLVWERTEKIDANHRLIRQLTTEPSPAPAAPVAPVAEPVPSLEAVK